MRLRWGHRSSSSYKLCFLRDCPPLWNQRGLQVEVKWSFHQTDEMKDRRSVADPSAQLRGQRSWHPLASFPGSSEATLDGGFVVRVLWDPVGDPEAGMFLAGSGPLSWTQGTCPLICSILPPTDPSTALGVSQTSVAGMLRGWFKTQLSRSHPDWGQGQGIYILNKHC